MRVASLSPADNLLSSSLSAIFLHSPGNRGFRSSEDSPDSLGPTGTGCFDERHCPLKRQAKSWREFQEGINAVSAPVFNKGGHVFGSISVVGPTFRMPGEKMHLYGKECARKAERISSILRLFPNNENETDFISKMKYTLGIG